MDSENEKTAETETVSEEPQVGESVVESAPGGGSESTSESSKLEFAQAQAKENFDKFLRAAAELENFKKRAAKERSDLLKYAGENMARDLLDVLDNLERALAAAQTTSGEELVNGVRMILEQFRQTFERHGVRGESALNGMFDPTKQEALASVPTADKEPNTVIDEYRKTYFFKDKLLRAGQVVVAVQPPEEAQAPEI